MSELCKFNKEIFGLPYGISQRQEKILDDMIAAGGGGGGGGGRFFRKWQNRRGSAG